MKSTGTKQNKKQNAFILSLTTNFIAVPVTEEAGIQNGDMVRLGEKSKDEMASELNKLQSLTTPSGRKVRGGDSLKRGKKKKRQNE
jgi:hypothetical protein